MLSDYPDTSKYQDYPDRKPLDPGTYNLKVFDIKDEDKNGNPYKNKEGFPYIMVVFDVLDSDDGHKLFDRIVLDPAYAYHEIQMSRLKQLITATGLPTTGGRWEDLLGRKLRAYVKTRVYQEKTYNDIGKYEIDEVPPSTDPADRPADKDLPF